jgi:hypothetical protein
MLTAYPKQSCVFLRISVLSVVWLSALTALLALLC